MSGEAWTVTAATRWSASSAATDGWLMTTSPGNLASRSVTSSGSWICCHEAAPSWLVASTRSRPPPLAGAVPRA